MNKLIILILLLNIFLVSFTNHQETCFLDPAYSQSTFQLKKVTKTKYKTEFTSLGLDYPNPCIYKISADNGSMRVFCSIKDKTKRPSINVKVLEQKKSLFSFLTKYKCYNLVEDLGDFETSKEISFNVRDTDSFTLLFINKIDPTDRIAIKLTKVSP